ncbi:hypothetical protein ABH940_002312 [Streptacidiphilus sp. BW17]|uniref:outer membrane protein assembly factor BamB family protein n=1 Tax=Streptacidiphilus sp. BW17 TaxID=3156274 RepID=UPI0035132848
MTEQTPGNGAMPAPGGPGIPGYGYPSPNVPPQQPPAAGAGYGYPTAPPQQGMPPVLPQGQPGQQGMPPMPPPMGQPMPQQQPFGQFGPYQQVPYQQGQFVPQGSYPQSSPYAQGQPMPGQPGPYQQVPGQQPTMAPPIQGMPPMPPAGQGGPKKGLLYGAIGGGLALILIIVAVFVFGGGGGGGPLGGGGSAPALATGWHTNVGPQQDSLVGNWLTDKYVVRGSVDGVKAYDRASGTLAWTVQPPTGANVPCSMSPTVSSSGIGTIAFGTDDHTCTTVVGVDTSTGHVLWNTPLTLSSSSGATPSDATTLINGNVAAVLSDGLIDGVDVSSGTPVWTYKPRDQSCSFSLAGAGSTILSYDFCPNASQPYMMTALNAATGAQLWQTPGSDQKTVEAVLSSSPLIAQVQGADGTNSTNLYDSSGNPTPVSGGNSIEGGGTPIVQMVGSTTLVAETTAGSSGDTAGVEAIDVTSGKVLWTYLGDNKAGADLAFAPGTSGTAIYALSSPPSMGGSGNGALVTLSPTTGAATTLATLPYSSGTDIFAARGPLIVPGSGSAHSQVYLINYGSVVPGIQVYK